jgi:hypothetical protein
MGKKEWNRRQARWGEMLAEYNFKNGYKAGKLMGKPDALNRRFELIEGMKAKEQGERKLIGKEKWDLESFELMEMDMKEDEEELREDEEEELKYMLEEERMMVLKLAHDDLSAGHFGEKRLTS